MASSSNIDEEKNKQTEDVIAFIDSIGRKPTDLIIATDDGETNYEITLLYLVTKMISEMPRRFKSVIGFATNRYKLKSGKFVEYYLKGGRVATTGFLTFSIFNKTGRKIDEGEHSHSGDWQLHWDPSNEYRNDMTFKTLAYAHTHVTGDILVGHEDGPESVDTSVEPFKPKRQVQPVGLAIYKPF